jgi:hypothetical protein
MTISSRTRRRASRNRAQRRPPENADSESLAAIAAGPNPNLGRGERDDIERPTRQRDDGGGIEST